MLRWGLLNWIAKGGICVTGGMLLFLCPSTISCVPSLPSREEDASFMSPNLKWFHSYLARRGMPVRWRLYVVKVSESYQ